MNTLPKFEATDTSPWVSAYQVLRISWTMINASAPGKNTMSRLQEKTYAELTPAQQATFDDIVANRPVKPEDGHIGGPFDVWLRSPEMGKRLVGLGSFFRFRTGVDRRYIKLAGRFLR